VNDSEGYRRQQHDQPIAAAVVPYSSECPHQEREQIPAEHDFLKHWAQRHLEHYKLPVIAKPHVLPRRNADRETSTTREDAGQGCECPIHPRS
jgi:hypothetical protein